jgi:LacI family transcriptional regulator
MGTIRRVAVMIDLQWPLKHHQDVFAGTQRYARERGNWECVIDLHAGESLHPGSSEYDGVIARATSRLALRARRAAVPVVNVWLNSPARKLPAVFHDVQAAGRLAANHLMARGIRQFGHLGYHRDRSSVLGLNSFRAVVQGAGFPCDSELVPIDFGKDPATWRRFLHGLEQWVQSWRCPVGVFVAHDVLARYLATVCLRQGVRVPEDAALVGSANESVICLHPEPALSSVEFNFEEVGFRAGELLDRLMDGAEPPKEPILVPPVELVARQSTDVFAVSDPMVAQAMRFIADNCRQPLRVGHVTAHVHTGRRTLERRFQHAVGRTISSEIVRLRIEQVKRQLVESDAPLKNLATRLGFQNEKRLCEAFRRLEGITPGEYRSRRRAPERT